MSSNKPFLRNLPMSMPIPKSSSLKQIRKKQPRSTRIEIKTGFIDKNYQLIHVGPLAIDLIGPLFKKIGSIPRGWDVGHLLPGDINIPEEVTDCLGGDSCLILVLEEFGHLLEG